MSAWLQRFEDEYKEHDPSRWMVSYADFVTLLMAFFVVMYSISQVNETKYKALTSTLVEAFNLGSEEDISKDENFDPLAKLEESDYTSSQSLEDGSDASTELQQQLERIAEHANVQVVGDEQWLQIELPSEVLFESGGTTLNNNARSIIGDIAAILSTHDNAIRVEGFTDNKPISTLRYDSNWALSSARATSVVQLLEKSGISPKRMAAIGYGEFQPIASNATAEGRARNRRIVLMVSSSTALRPKAKAIEQGASIGAQSEKEGITDVAFDPGQWVKGADINAREQAEKWLERFGQPLPLEQQAPQRIELEDIEDSQ